MHKLSRTQLDQITQQFRQTDPHQALADELLDHIASLIEHRMDEGQTFPAASAAVMQSINPETMAQLKALYLGERTTQATTSLPILMSATLRPKRRPATKPFHYILLSSLLTFLLLIGFLVVVSRPLAIPMAAFRTAWGALGLAGILVLRWWQTSQHRRSKRYLRA